MNGEAIDKEGFHRLVTYYADLLKRNGAQPGDRILITISISTKFYAMAVATLAIGKWTAGTHHRNLLSSY